MGKYTKKDPYLERELKNYEYPVPSRELISDYLKSESAPRTYAQMFNDFGLEEHQSVGLKRRLRAMERDGQLIKGRRGSYALMEETEVVRGSVLVHRDGFGFLVPDDGGSDIFLAARQVRGLFTDDVVLVRVVRESRRGRREGVVVEVVEQNTQHIVGRLYVDGSIGFVTPDSNNVNQDIVVAADDFHGAKHKQFVVIEMIPSDRKSQLKGRVVEILGDQLTAGMEVELAIRAHEIPHEWPKAVDTAVSKMPDCVAKKDYKKREDLRDLPFVTIDGEDARDYDDAVYAEKTDDGWRVMVAIADVSHYVKPKDAIDIEAQSRGNSVYFPSRVIPMLPECLSNELCSLKPCVDRLALVCEIELNRFARPIHYRFFQAVIHSHARLTYTQVIEHIQGKGGLDTELHAHVDTLYKVYKKLLQQRMLRGAIDFDTLENKIIFDDRGKIDKVVSLARNEAHRLIEELMLLANNCSADFINQLDIPVLFRNHDVPDSQKLETVRDFLKVFGLRLGGKNEPVALDYSKLIARIQNRPDAHLLQTVLLRSLKQARFETENKGHFGLAYDCYCQFTSPIRRYPDLIVHRAIKKAMKFSGHKKYPYTEESMQQLGDHCSMTERRADRATREASDWLKCDYMKDKLGQTFTGIISDVVGFGLFVTLNDIYVEGLVHINNLDDDYYHFDSTHHYLEGRRRKKKYRLGDEITIVVARVDLDQRKIDFDIA